MKNIAIYIRVLCILFCATVAAGGIFTVLADRKKEEVQQTAAAGNNTVVTVTEQTGTMKENKAVTAEGDSPAVKDATAEGDSPAVKDATAKGDSPAVKDVAAEGDSPAVKDATAKGDSPAVKDVTAEGDSPAVKDATAEGDSPAVKDATAKGDSPAVKDATASGDSPAAKDPEGSEPLTEAKVQLEVSLAGTTKAEAAMKKGHRATDRGEGDVMTQMEHIGNSNQPAIALTFDDGPSDGPTDRILDVLEQHHAHATFFVMGYRVEKYADKINRAISLGCEIGNHSYNHPKLTAITESKAETQIKKTKKQVQKVTAVTPSLVRPPYGAYNDTVLSLIKAPAILWSLDTRDWKTRDADKTVKAVLDNVQDGDIILMHDLYEPTAKAVERLVPELIERGYQLVTVPELAALKGKKLKKGKTYSDLTAEE